MKTFLHDDFLLTHDTAKILFHEYAKDMPIIDYHCHINPQEIAQNRRFENLAQAWLENDHYKWRLMRLAGTDESLITGDACDYDKFIAFAQALPQAAGNPVYTWTHMELARYFDCDVPLCPQTADEIWDMGLKKLALPDMSVRGIISRSKVETIATTDDPADSLRWHKAIAEDDTFTTQVVPTFRPDKALCINKPEFSAYMRTLGAGNWEELLEILIDRMDFFDQMGCRASDHGLECIPFTLTNEKEAAQIFNKAFRGECPTLDETAKYQTALLIFLGCEYAKRGWVMQLHYGAMRNVNAYLYSRLGADIGNDAISDVPCSNNIAKLLSYLSLTDYLPKTVLYSLNPNDNIPLQAIGGCFKQVQHGSAWWFNDTRHGIEKQLTDLASCGLLGGFIGMLTDSRSFLSYVRHEYFRRILCNLLGGLVENGEYPRDLPVLGDMVQRISYYNTKRYFGF
jgi:glucuronate isomerase